MVWSVLKVESFIIILDFLSLSQLHSIFASFCLLRRSLRLHRTQSGGEPGTRQVQMQRRKRGLADAKAPEPAHHGHMQRDLD